MKLWMVLGGLLSLVSCLGPSADPFVFQMDWTHEAEFMGLYAALDQGHFSKAGLAVTLVEGPAGTDIPSILESGRVDAAQMGMTMFTTAVGQGADLMALMATLQTSSRVLMTLAERGVRSPRDLEGKRVGVKSASWAILIRRVMVNGGADPRRLVEVPVGGRDIERFYRGDVDVWTGFATSEPVQAQLAGHPVSLLFADDYGAGGYDELIVVKRTSFEQNKEKYRRFVQALVRGWAWSVDHDQEAVRLLDRWQSGETHEFHALAWKALRPLVSTGRVPIGWIENVRWPSGAPFTTDLLGKP